MSGLVGRDIFSWHRQNKVSIWQARESSVKCVMREIMFTMHNHIIWVLSNLISEF